MRESVGINKREVIVFGMEWIIFGVKGRGETNQRCKVPGSSPLAKQMLCACVCVCVCVCVCARVPVRVLGGVRIYAISWTVAHWALLPMEFSRQEYWSRLPFPSPGDRPNLEIEPMFPVSPALAGRFFPTSTTWELNRGDLLSF